MKMRELNLFRIGVNLMIKHDAPNNYRMENFNFIKPKAIIQVIKMLLETTFIIYKNKLV